MLRCLSQMASLSTTPTQVLPPTVFNPAPPVPAGPPDAHGHSHGAVSCHDDHSHDHAGHGNAGGYIPDQYNFSSAYVQPQAYATAPLADPLPPMSHARMW